jgi:hypothetical protein
MNEEGLERVHFELPNHWAVAGETVWATPLGDSLYRIENVPFYAYGVNFHDVVRAKESSEGILEVEELIEISGHRTFRIFFNKDINEENQDKILSDLNELTITYEGANKIYFSLDMKPETDYCEIYDKLEELVERNILEFETCEAKVKGSFDDMPEEDS